MRDYQHYSAAQLAEIEDFIKWVKYPEQFQEIDLFWRNWLLQHPQKKDEVEEARNIIFALSNDEGSYDVEDRQKALWSRIQESVNTIEGTVRRKSIYHTLKFRVLASIFILIASSVIWFFVQKPEGTVLSSAHDSIFIKEVNYSPSAKMILLGDGSKVIVEPKSSIQYPETFKNNIREIKLEGEAFFDVAKDPAKPFVVYSNNLVTQVTGTSFTIRDFKDGNNSFVQVKTGKVSVFTNDDVRENQRKGSHQLEGVLLTPNQQVIFSKDESRLIKSLVENPILLGKYVKQSFEFKDTKLTDVFSLIEKAYGVEIIYDDELMEKCQLNASLNDMSLFDKMRLICKGANVKYEILDSKIIVTGKGCE